MLPVVVLSRLNSIGRCSIRPQSTAAVVMIRMVATETPRHAKFACKRARSDHRRRGTERLSSGSLEAPERSRRYYSARVHRHRARPETFAGCRDTVAATEAPR